MPDEIAPLDEEHIRVMPDLVRSIQDLRLAAIMAVGKPAHLRAVQALERLVDEIHRLRTGPWLDEVAQEIASDPRCSDPRSANARAIAETLRRFAARTPEPKVPLTGR